MVTHSFHRGIFEIFSAFSHTRRARAHGFLFGERWRRWRCRFDLNSGWVRAEYHKRYIRGSSHSRTSTGNKQQWRPVVPRTNVKINKFTYVAGSMDRGDACKSSSTQEEFLVWWRVNDGKFLNNKTINVEWKRNGRNGRKILMQRIEQTYRYMFHY